MRIHAKGHATREFAPDKVIASVSFNLTKITYQEALEAGTQMVTNYIAAIAERTGFNAADFKTNSYNIREHFHTGASESKDLSDIGKSGRRISDGFEFTQRATLEFDYDINRLSALLLSTAGSPDAPQFNISFDIKDRDAARRALIPEAYAIAQAKAQTVAQNAGYTNVTCEEIFLDDYHQHASVPAEAAKGARLERIGVPTISTFEDRLQNINANFHPEPIKITKHIDSIWIAS